MNHKFNANIAVVVVISRTMTIMEEQQEEAKFASLFHGLVLQRWCVIMTKTKYF